MLPDDIRESIAIGGFTSISGQPSSLSNLAYSNSISNNNLTQQNTVANQQAMNQVGQSVLGTTVNLVANLSPMEAVATVKLDTGNDVAQQLADLQGTVAAFASPARPHPGPPRPPGPPLPPVPPLPSIKVGPQGALTATASPANYPLTIVIDDNISTYSVQRDSPSGTLLNVNTRHFPVQLDMRDSKQAVAQTVANVSRSKFPLQVKHGINQRPIVEELSNGWTILTVNEKKHPVKINLTP
ncbi:MAG TPA: hypothetical protein VE842_04770 [Pyrinomonadaceae bacterium]|nr:hypothetical protein [Pyrinomonadaceae bacterium]